MKKPNSLSYIKGYRSGKGLNEDKFSYNITRKLLEKYKPTYNKEYFREERETSSTHNNHK